MAKIIKRGFLPAAAKPWPLGEKLQCDLCGCKWEIETNNDFFRIHANASPVSSTAWAAIAPLQIGRVRVNCPTCGNAHELKDTRS